MAMHGALASLLSFADANVARQEVLYVGETFGSGLNNAWKRTRKHEKLQQIYGKITLTSDCEIFVSAALT